MLLTDANHVPRFSGELKGAQCADGQPCESTEECLYCEQRFCLEHLNRCEGCNLGPACSACAEKHGWKQGVVCDYCLDEPEPDCNCTRVDVDLYDPRGCEFHDDDSDWNRRRKRIDRALEAA